ncbi:MAG: GNAT family N-acetyltransferase [Planctomycetes bacterium]|nr:GNAT family N-acetyltransferase [Planctomycetota bacterium]
MWRISPYEPSHRDGVVHVVKSVFDEYGFTWEADGYCSDLYNVERVYLQPGGMFWCAVDAEEKGRETVIGCAGLTFHDDHSELHRMYLLSACRGRGIGRALLLTCMEHARRKAAAPCGHGAMSF